LHQLLTVIKVPLGDALAFMEGEGVRVSQHVSHNTRYSLGAWIAYTRTVRLSPGADVGIIRAYVCKRGPLNKGKELFLIPGPPVNVGSREGRDVPTVQLSFNVKSVSDIDAVKFEFQAVLDIVMHWSDENIWAECKANGEEIEKGRCQYVWKPKLVFPNAREVLTPTSRKYLWWGPARAPPPRK